MAKDGTAVQASPRAATVGQAARPSAPLSADLLRKMHAYWRAANYLSVGQTYLFGNPLLTEPLQLKHIKPRLLGHWTTGTGTKGAAVASAFSEASYGESGCR